MDPLITVVPYLLIGLISLVMGLLIGALLMNLFMSKEPSQPSRNRRLVEVLRVWQDKRSKRLNVEINGRMFKSADELSDKWRSGLNRLLGELYIWSDLAEPGVPDLEARIAVSPPTPQPSASERPPASPTYPAKQEMPPTPTMTSQPPGVPTPKPTRIPEDQFLETLLLKEELAPPSMRPLDALARVIRPGKPEEDEEPKSIVGQIDAILQEKLPTSPLRSRAIRLAELAEGGMAVIVDSDRYEGVNDIPDPDVRALLQECVAEWERRIDSG